MLGGAGLYDKNRKRAVVDTSSSDNREKRGCYEKYECDPTDTRALVTPSIFHYQMCARDAKPLSIWPRAASGSEDGNCSLADDLKEERRKKKRKKSYPVPVGYKYTITDNPLPHVI